MIDYIEFAFDVLLASGDIFTYICLPIFVTALPLFAISAIKSLFGVL